MGFLDKPKLSEPNELGFQFGINESLTEYAHKKQPQWGGSSLPSVKITVLEVWKDADGYEATAVAIDMFKAIKQSELIENGKQ